MGKDLPKPILAQQSFWFSAEQLTRFFSRNSVWRVKVGLCILKFLSTVRIFKTDVQQIFLRFDFGINPFFETKQDLKQTLRKIVEKERLSY